jgi:hypothetical protein
MNPTLKTCPFCGGSADVRSGKSTYDKVMGRQLYYAQIFCDKPILCGAKMDMILNDETAAIQMLSEQWNTRTP